MATTVFPAQSAASGVNANTVTSTIANTLYSSALSLSKGVYQITTSPTSSVAVVDFWSGNTYIGSATTISGTVTYNLATSADTIYFTTTSNSTNITITLVANAAIVAGVSGTLDTLTNSQTYTQTGKAYVLVVGGGGGGMGSMFGNFGQGGGGGGGGLLASPYLLTGNTSVVIGAGGTPGTGGNPNPNISANAGGATVFGNLTANGGGGGIKNGGGSAGTPSGYVGTNGTANGGTGDQGGGSNSNPYPFVKTGNNGGGNGGGSGIGTGGNAPGDTYSNGNAGTGYGAGGGGKGNSNAATQGGAGTAGVVYVLRGF